MKIVEVMTVISICVLLVILLALMAFALIEFLKSIEGRRMVRTMKDVFSTILSCMSPSTPLQREIREEERTIKQLEAQKADMQRLAALKRKREALFEDVGEADFKARVYTPEQTEKILNDEIDIRSICLACGKGYFEYGGCNYFGIEIDQCTYCSKEIAHSSWKGASG